MAAMEVSRWLNASLGAKAMVVEPWSWQRSDGVGSGDESNGVSGGAMALAMEMRAIAISLVVGERGGGGAMDVEERR
ncbi:hypothetical protein LguiA_014249 [Lonicera macranthoides]